MSNERLLRVDTGDLGSECSAPFLSSLSFLLIFFSKWLASDVRMRIDRYHEIFMPKINISYDTDIYRRLLWRTGDIVKKIPITLYHRLIPREHEMAFSGRPLYFIIMSSINCWRTRCIDQQQQQQHSVVSAILAITQQSVRNTATLIITPTFRRASTFRLWG